jgi:hypothetical protein
VRPDDVLVVIGSSPELSITVGQLNKMVESENAEPSEKSSTEAGRSVAEGSNNRNNSDGDSANANNNDGDKDVELLKSKRAALPALVKKRQEVGSRRKQKEKEVNREKAEVEREKAERVQREQDERFEREEEQRRELQHRTNEEEQERMEREMAEEKVRRIHQNKKSAEEKKLQEQERREKERQAEQDEAELRHKRLRHVSRMKHAGAAEEEERSPSLPPGGKRKVSAPTFMPLVNKVVRRPTKLTNNTGIASALNNAAGGSGAVNPPTFNIGHLATAAPNLGLKKLLENDAQNRRTSKARSDLQSTGAKEVIMRHGFKTGMQALQEGTTSGQPSSDPGSNVPTSPSPIQLRIHQVPATRPGGNKRMQAHDQFWKKRMYSQGEDSFVEGSSREAKRKH